MPKAYFAILKHRKKLPTKERYTHLFILPNGENEFLYLGVFGLAKDEPASYVTQLIVRFPGHLLESILDGEAEQFGERFEVLEQIECSIEDVRDGCYSIHLDAPGRYIRSDLKISFNEQLSGGSKKIYILSGVLKI